MSPAWFEGLLYPRFAHHIAFLLDEQLETLMASVYLHLGVMSPVDQLLLGSSGAVRLLFMWLSCIY